MSFQGKALPDFIKAAMSSKGGKPPVKGKPIAKGAAVQQGKFPMKKGC